MTPLRLTLREFGPYTDQQTIDFASLGEQRLFLIHGPTGSGKTALLDAICFGLYGETSGDERDGHELRSDFAADDAPTEVELDFRLGQRTFRITRRPRQELAKQRGDGFTTHSEEATLWERTKLTDEGRQRGGDGDVVAEGKRDVDAAIHELLGFEVDQFRQVVMLPQGKFRRFLASSSSDREDLLKVLFETSPFENLQDTLFEMKKEAREEVQRIRDRQSVELERHGVETVEGLEARRDKATRVLEHATDRLDTLKARREDAMEALQSARKDRETLDELHEARNELAALENSTDAHNERKRTLRAAEQTANVAPYETALTERREEADEAREVLEDALSTRDEAKARLESAEDAYENEQERDDERASLRQQLSTLDDLADTVDELGRVDEELEDAARRQEEARARQSESEAKKADLKDERESTRERRADKQQLAGQIDFLKTKAEDAHRRLEEASTLAQKRDELQTAEAALREANEAVDTCESRLTDAEAHLDGLEQRRIEGYATVLARDLSDGEPCPVCGGREHPQPATGAHDVPDPTELEEARAAVTAARKALSDARDRRSDARAEEARIQTTIETILSRDEDLADTDPDTLRETRNSAQDRLDAARTAQEELITLDEAIARYDEELSDLEEEISAAQSIVQQAETERTRLKSRRDTLSEDVPENLSTPEALDKAREAAQSTLDKLEGALETATQERDDARTAYTEAKTTVENARVRLEDATEKASTAEDRFRSELNRAGFEQRSAYDEARRPEDEREELRRRIEQFESDLSDARGRLERAREAAQGIDAPDVEAAEAQTRRLGRRLDQHQQRVFNLERTVDDAQDGLDALADLRQALADSDERYRDVGALADAARGKNDHNLSLQRFVLATRLEEVLQIANQHVARMSQDRYRLRRHDEVRHGGRAAGLDLMVHDAYTGAERPVSTLSGGEGFQAALALALGLSDVVQRVAGGRHIETIFIDEGFGSLDPEALDRAMESLASLQAGGRLVGIISHVTDLKQRVQARIEVSPSQQGSTVSLVR